MIELRYKKKRVCFVPTTGLTMAQITCCKEIVAEKLGTDVTKIEAKYTPVGGGGKNV